MPFALIIVGLVLLVAGVRDTTSDLYDLVKGDFSGKGSFVFWMVAVLVLGAIGYFESIRPLSRAFLVLVIVGLIVKKGNGLFDRLNQQLKQPTSSDGAQPIGAQK